MSAHEERAAREKISCSLLSSIPFRGGPLNPRAAGATIPREGGETFWGGYSGYWADPDGHVWEVAMNPFWPLNADGSLTLPE